MKKTKLKNPVKINLLKQLEGSGYGEYGSELVRYRIPEEISLRIKKSAEMLKVNFNFEMIRRLCVYFLKTREAAPASNELEIMNEVVKEFIDSVEESRNKLSQHHENTLVKFMTASMYNVSFVKADDTVTVGNFQIDTIIFNDIKLTAQLYKRSVNSEIVARLERSLNLEYPNKEEVEKIKKLQFLLLLNESFIKEKMK